MRAIVTGASGGLGLDFAKLLAADGMDLVLVARSGDKLEKIAAELRATSGRNVEIIAQDLGVFDAAARIKERVSACDVLVNNAGFANRGRFDDIGEQQLREEVMLDVVALTELTRLYLPGMRAIGKGRILNVASTAGFLPGPYMAVYYAAKAYVISFSQAISEELRGTGVTVTCLCPGATATGFADRAKMNDTLLFRTAVADSQSVAKAGYEAMMSGKDLCVPGLRNKLTVLSTKLTPRRLLLAVSGRLVR
jgi:short-subunit dehydrogenase